ncbi:MAG TPA: GNAT family N-acetyltransferase [Clostridia bacterium]|nr:GNAT family N-acetyltransferase [Clostridia bacterium]
MLRRVGTRKIETQRLVLRPLAPEDADAMYHNFASDAEVSRFMRWTPYQSVEETKRDLMEIAASYASNQTYRWGVCLRDGTLIGTVGVSGMDERDERAEIAYCLGRAYWGQGYAAEAIRGVLERMFSEVGLNRIEAYHAVDNPASGRVMQKAGMTLEGHARQKYRTREGFQDCDLYGITREDWETQKEIEVYNALPVAFEDFYGRGNRAGLHGQNARGPRKEMGARLCL